MRFKKGTRVEVLDKKELPLGFWRCGEIISDNRCSYTVRYYNQSRKNTLAKVAYSVLRPYPPHLGIPEKWALGDVLEVFCDFSWKMAKVVRSLGCHFYMVRILGSSEVLRVGVSETRVRQSWHNGKWVVIGQVSDASYECGQVQVETPMRESLYVCTEAGAQKKRRICAEERICSSQVIANQSKPCKLIDVSSSRIQDSAECSTSSSVGSCSINDADDHCKISSPEFSARAVDKSGCTSDAESCSHGTYDKRKRHYTCSNNSGEGSEDEVHVLELSAYRRTLKALHASGALSWEQESLLSNLRVFLNISSEEHSTELRRLLSSNKVTPFR